MKDIFSKSSVKPFVISLTAMMLALAVHQMYVAPKISEFRKK